VATQLEIVNDVLLRMRLDTINTVASSAYSKLVATLVNDAKRMVEDAHHWSHLWSSVEITTSANTTQYSLVGSNERTTIYQLIDATNQNTLRPMDNPEMTYREKIATTANNAPTHYRVRGVDSNGALYLDLWPTPGGTYTLWADCIIPQNNLAVDGTDNNTSIIVPAEPVILRAYAYAIKERGEDEGTRYADALEQAKRSLGRAISMDRNNQPDRRVYRVV